MADVGSQIAIHRRVSTRFGLETWARPTHHLDGSLFRVGRLQFHLRQTVTAQGPLEAGDWFIGLHIPGDGPLDPVSVDDSRRAAAGFFGHYFAEMPVGYASCESWLLDPHLAAEHLAATAGGRAHGGWRHLAGRHGMDILADDAGPNPGISPPVIGP